MSEHSVRRALVSVSDKTGLLDFAQTLIDSGFELVSTGGTRRHLEEAGLPVINVSDYTGFPEIMQGRVKTLHPRVHGAILGMPDLPDHAEAIAEHGIVPFELVVCNLYPFEQTVARPDVELADAIEQIDIGGPSMVRSAAKNHKYIGIVTRPEQYAEVGEALKAGTLSRSLRYRLALEAFRMTAAYDVAIANYLGDQIEDEEESFAETLQLSMDKVADLRSGENPHQRAAFYRDATPDPGTLPTAKQLNGKGLSYNNLLDLDAALRIVREFRAPAAAVLKHNNPCGCAIGDSLESAYRRAHAGDPVSAFGSIVSFNRPVDAETARAMAEPGQFIEAIIAPEFSEEGLRILTTEPKWKKNVRLMACPDMLEDTDATPLDFRRVSGGFLVQELDDGTEPESGWTVVTEREPTDQERRDLAFVWLVTKHVKSNAIVFAKDGMVTGVGAGQMSRLDSTFMAAYKSDGRAEGGCLGSDAFFPFRDGVDEAAKAGIRAIIQPGGSVKDEEVIAACNEHGIAMIFTHRRHFKH